MSRVDDVMLIILNFTNHVFGFLEVQSNLIHLNLCSQSDIIKYFLPASSEKRRGGGIMRERSKAYAAHARGVSELLKDTEHALPKAASPTFCFHLHLVTETIYSLRYTIFK